MGQSRVDTWAVRLPVASRATMHAAPEAGLSSVKSASDVTAMFKAAEGTGARPYLATRVPETTISLTVVRYVAVR